MSENSFFMLSLLIWLVVIVLFLIIKVKWGKNSRAIVQSVAINLILFSSISLLWFFKIAIDGISQVMGVFFYFVFGAILFVISMIVVKINSKKSKHTPV